jgi:hypothetical protein
MLLTQVSEGNSAEGSIWIGKVCWFHTDRGRINPELVSVLTHLTNWNKSGLLHQLLSFITQKHIGVGNPSLFVQTDNSVVKEG